MEKNSQHHGTILANNYKLLSCLLIYCNDVITNVLVNFNEKVNFPLGDDSRGSLSMLGMKLI